MNIKESVLAAIANNDLEELKRQLTVHPEVFITPRPNTIWLTPKSGRDIFLSAAKLDHAEILEYLCQMSQRRPFDAYYQLALDAIDDNNLEAIKRYVSRFPELLTHQDANVVASAASKSRIAILDFFRQAGANLETPDSLGVYPLKRAASDLTGKTARFLLAQGVSLSTYPNSNALLGAVREGNLEMCRALIEYKFDIHFIFRSVTGKLKNAMSFAIENNQQEIMKLLAENGCRVPVEGVDIPQLDLWAEEGDDRREVHTQLIADQDSGSTAVASQSEQTIVEYMKQLYGPVDPSPIRELLPIHDQVHIALRIIRPNEMNPYLTIFTTGMSDLPMPTPAGEEIWKYAELLMHLPPTWPLSPQRMHDSAVMWPLQWLRKMAYFPHLNQTWLGGRFTIVSSAEPPEPLGPLTKHTCLLLIADFKSLAPLQVQPNRTVHFYKVTSLTTEERNYERKHGIAKLVSSLIADGDELVCRPER